jgi:hypothetical protein
MRPQRFTLVAASCGTLVLNGWIAAGLAGPGSLGIDNGRAPITVDPPPPAAIAKHGADGVFLPETGIANASWADLREVLPPAPIQSVSTVGPVQNDIDVSRRPVEIPETERIGAALPDPHQTLPPETLSVRLVSLSGSIPLEEELKPAGRVIETLNECFAPEICIDDYLWSFYERTPKVDTNKVTARMKATVKKKGKTRTLIKTITKYVVGDFTWKDPIAAKRAGMSVKDYVIGGMDRGFKLKLYHALRAMDDAGLMPGITSGFRDDYRQSIASGNKAASDSSFHGGSRRGGYGHGVAADLVSVKGETRLERFASSVKLWKWIDAREKELGIGRPYLKRDPPHVGPINGQEYAIKRGGAKTLSARGDGQGIPSPSLGKGGAGADRHSGRKGPVDVTTPAEPPVEAPPT